MKKPLACAICLLTATMCAAVCDSTTKILPDVATASIVRSSHSAGAAIVADHLKLTDGKRSAVAIQGDIEAAIYSCQCQKNIHH